MNVGSFCLYTIHGIHYLFCTLYYILYTIYPMPHRVPSVCVVFGALEFDWMPTVETGSFSSKLCAAAASLAKYPGWDS